MGPAPGVLKRLSSLQHFHLGGTPNLENKTLARLEAIMIHFGPLLYSLTV